MVIDKIASIGQQLGFNEVDSANVQELLDPHHKDLSDNDLINAEPHSMHRITMMNAPRENMVSKTN